MEIVTAESINCHLKKARRKHPEFTLGSRCGFTAVLLEEVCEVLFALFWERSEERVRSELLDVVAVIIRRLEGK